MLPLYGQYPFRAIDHLQQQLLEVSQRWLKGATWSAYAVLRSDQKYYGLTLAELTDLCRQRPAELASFTVLSSGASGQVVRLNVQFFPPPTPHRVRYLIATGQPQLDYAIRRTLTGEEVPGATARVAQAAPRAEIIAPAPRTRDAIFKPSRRHFSQPTLSLHDFFSFDPDLSADILVDLLNGLSQRYLGEASFHLRLETIDGDFHLHLDRRELRYLFHYQRDQRLMLYLDAVDGHEQWLHLRLSYHPLAIGPNAEVSLLSNQAEALLDDLKATLAAEERPWRLPERLHGTYRFSSFTLTGMLKLVQAITDRPLPRVPAVAVVIQEQGAPLRGLSTYQLRQNLSEEIEGVQHLVFFLGRISTGQTCLLWFYPGEAGWHLELSLMWGEEEVHQHVLAQVAAAGAQPQAPVAAPSQGGQALLLPVVAGDRPREAWWGEVLAARGASAWRIPLQQSHRDWEEVALGLAQAEEVVLDSSYQHPGLIGWAELARRLGRRVVVAVEQGRTLLPALQDWPRLTYQMENASPQAWAQDWRRLDAH